MWYWNPNERYFDEIYYPRSGIEYLKGVRINSDWEYPFEWTHPPLTKLLIALSIWMFGGVAHGDSGWGWRFLNVVCGTLMVPLCYLFAKRLLGSTLFASIAAFMLTFDGFRFVQSRIATPEIWVATFGLGRLVRVLSALDGNADSHPASDSGRVRLALHSHDGRRHVVAVLFSIGINKLGTPATDHDLIVKSHVFAFLYAELGIYVLARWIGRRFADPAATRRELCRRFRSLACRGTTQDRSIRRRRNRGAGVRRSCVDLQTRRRGRVQDARRYGDLHAGRRDANRGRDRQSDGRADVVGRNLHPNGAVWRRANGTDCSTCSFCSLRSQSCSRSVSFRVPPSSEIRADSRPISSSRGCCSSWRRSISRAISRTTGSATTLPTSSGCSGRCSGITTSFRSRIPRRCTIRTARIGGNGRRFSRRSRTTGTIGAPVQRRRMVAACCVAEILALPNPLVWWFGLFSVPAMAWWGYVERNKGYLLLFAAYLFQWLPWILTPRIAFEYHFFPNLPDHRDRERRSSCSVPGRKARIGFGSRRFSRACSPVSFSSIPCSPRCRSRTISGTSGCGSITGSTSFLAIRIRTALAGSNRIESRTDLRTNRPVRARDDALRRRGAHRASRHRTVA